MPLTDPNDAAVQGEGTTSPIGKRLSAPTLLAINALAIAFIATLFIQVLHEASHGAIAWLFEAPWEWAPMFSSSITGPSKLGIWADLAIAGAPAILNILVGTLAVAAFEIQGLRQHPGLRLLTYYVAALSLFAGFSYLLFDPIVYQTGKPAGDWQQVIGLLRGDWLVRASISLIGAAGMVRSLAWLCQSTLRFADPLNESPGRIPLAFPLLMVPYIGVNLIFNLLAIRHASEVSTLSGGILVHWLNTMGFFWAFFFVAYGMRRVPSPAESTPVPPRILSLWCIMAAVGLAAAGLLLLPRLSVG